MVFGSIVGFDYYVLLRALLIVYVRSPYVASRDVHLHVVPFGSRSLVSTPPLLGRLIATTLAVRPSFPPAATVDTAAGVLVSPQRLLAPT